MSYKVVTIPPFDKQLKRLFRKYPSIKTDIQELGKKLSLNPTMGISLGHDCYKIRLSITSKGKGKSGGARVVTHFFIAGEIVFLLSIYDKSEKEMISDKELIQLLGSLNKV